MKFRYYFLVLSFVLFFSSPCRAFDPNIVIVNSYHYGQEWSTRELEGILEVLSAEFPEIRPPVEYLDTNRFKGEAQIRRVASYLADKYAGVNPRLVISLDNAALDLLIANRSRLFAESPIVFVGVNNFHPSMLKGYDKITGLAEVAGVGGSIELILKVHPDTEKIVILNDRTTTGQAIHRGMEPFIKKYKSRVDISFLYPQSFEDAQKQVASMPPQTVVLLASLVADPKGKTLTLAESTRLVTSGHRIPLYSMRENRLGLGVVGGNMISGLDHGRRVGRLALRVLAGEDPSSIPVDTNDYSMPRFDYEVLERLGISLDRLPAGSFVINKKPTFFEEHKIPILYALGIIGILFVAIILLCINNIKRRRAEKNLRELNRYKSALFEEARDALFVADLETGIILDANQAAERLTQRPRQELIGCHPSQLHPPDQWDRPRKIFPQQSQGLNKLTEGDILTKDGLKIPVEVNANLMDLPDGRRVIMGSFRDVSERNRLQELLLHSQKMEAVGTLAGGVAHEFNNALAAIMGSAELMQMDLPPQSPLGDSIDMILTSSKNAAQLTRNLLSFCRKQVQSPCHIDINSVLNKNEQLLRKLVGEDIEIVRNLCEFPCFVFADAGQIEQIIINIVINARDAMPTGGRLDIGTELVKANASARETAESEEAMAYVVMSFKDTGCGMDAATKEKIFEPFFSTKGVGQGTGLGLATVYGIVQQSGGFIEVKSETGCGTEFRIFLPFSVEAVQPEQEIKNMGSWRGSGTVLLVEDNGVVRIVLGEALRSGGYEVLEAEDGRKAVDLFAENSERIAAVVVDVVLPGMNGKEVHDKIKSLKPGTKVLLMSGYSDDIVTSKGIAQDQVDFLAKPFTPMQLLSKIKGIVDT
ncbi:MAG: response regulator [Deltaproteobacteria bacterium]|nr:response regulator [Deltaproteobacteria bacterium]